MLLTALLHSERSVVYQALQRLHLVILRNGVWRPTEDVQFVFLCGANREQGIPSRRREHLLEFSATQLPNTKFFLAESIFDSLRAGGHKDNILDVENELSQFADYIIMVLESESAFCELGAFASSPDLRKKLIVINDLRHKGVGSFIQLGPIKAIEETPGGDQKLLFYKMDPHGKTHGDGIGEVYAKLHKILHKEPRQRRNRVKQCDPNQFFTKDSLRFVHDLVFFTSPIYSEELSAIVEILFGRVWHKKLQQHLALLCAIEEITLIGKNLYRSRYDVPYFEYWPFDVHDILACFKNMYFRQDKERLG